MSIIYYFEDCPTCKNHNRILVRQAALAFKTAHSLSTEPVDERYVPALPAVWGPVVNTIGTPLPFLYNTDTEESLHVDYTDPTMMTKVNAFLEPLKAAT